ncbi:hypothetical protein K8T06_14010 [bacterium]|nr:hypothetical protein [bacterium]
MSHTDLFRKLRTLLKKERNHAYNSSWPVKYSRLIAPVLETLGYSLSPGRVTQKDLNIEPDIFLYRGEPDKPGAIPVAACVFADPYQNPFFNLNGPDNKYGVLHPDIHASRLLLNNLFERVIVTNGRLWRVYIDTKTGIQQVDVDLFDVLRLDSPQRSDIVPGESFQEFLIIMTSIWKFDESSYIDNDSSAFREALVDMIKQVQPDVFNMDRDVNECTFQILFMVYCELTGRIQPIDSRRWNLPELQWICQHPDKLDDQQLKTCFIAHFNALNDLDRSNNIASCFFYNPHEDLYDITSMHWLKDTKPEHIRSVISAVAKYLEESCSGVVGFGSLSVSEFSSLTGRLINQESTEIPTDMEVSLDKIISQRFKKVVQKSHELNAPDAPRGDHLRRYLSESLFRFHVVDSHPGTGTRLIQVLDQLERKYLDAMDASSLCPLHPRLPDLRSLLIRDAHENQLFLDHGSLSDSRLIRLQISQHCLYGVLNTEDLRVTPAILNLAVGLTGIRFPFTAHHYHPAHDTARERLAKDYSGNIPEPLQSISGTIAGTVAASRWFTEQELDLEAFGPNFAFTRAQFRMIMKRIIDFQEEHPDDQGIPLELVFPWIFHDRLTGSTGSTQSGSGFDFVIKNSSNNSKI